MNKKKVMGTLLVIGLVSLVYIAGINRGIAYEKNLYEDLGMDRVPFGSYMTFTVVKEDGSRVLAWAGHNVLTTVGLNACRWMISGVPGTNLNFTGIAIGTGSGGGVGSTALLAEIFRASATFDNITPVAGNWTLTKTWPAGTFSGQLVTEAGVFNWATGGILLNYQDFSAITLTAADSLEVEFEFMIAQG